MKILALGDSLFCTAFKLGGLPDVIPVELKEENVKAAMNSIGEGIGMVILQDKAFNLLHSKDKRAVENSTEPLFVIISLEGDEEAVEPIKAMVKRALGIEMK